MKILDYSYINSNCDTPLDCLRLSLVLQEAIAEIEASPQGTKIKSDYGINPKRTALKQCKADLESVYKNLNYWFNTVDGKEQIRLHPEFLEHYFSIQMMPSKGKNINAPLQRNCLF